MTSIEELTRLLKKLPGMGEKSATRLAYHLIKTDAGYNKALGTAIAELKDKVHSCPICGCYTEDEICSFSQNHRFHRYVIPSFFLGKKGRENILILT